MHIAAPSLFQNLGWLLAPTGAPYHLRHPTLCQNIYVYIFLESFLISKVQLRILESKRKGF